MPVPSARLAFSRGTLILEGISQAEIARLFGPIGWVWDRRVHGWRCDAIEYVEVLGRLREANYQVEDQVPQWKAIAWPKIALHSLREDQQAAVAAWKTTGRGVIVMPTGTGKTEVALTAMAETGTSTLVVAPVRDLMYQWHRRILAGLGYDAGIIGDNIFRVRTVSVTTYDSACIHMEQLGDQFGLIIFDECHHLPGEIRRDAARMSAARWQAECYAGTFRRPHAIGVLVGPRSIMPITRQRQTWPTTSCADPLSSPRRNV